MFNKDQLKSVKDVDNAARNLASSWGKRFSPAPSFDGRKKNKLRDVVCIFAGFDDGFRGFENYLKTIEAPIDVDRVYADNHQEWGYISIGDVEVSEKLFHDEMFDWELREREDTIDNLIMWISEGEHHNPRTKRFREALEKLLKVEDEFIWDSTHYVVKFVSPSTEVEEHNKICQGILAKYGELSD